MICPYCSDEHPVDYICEHTPPLVAAAICADEIPPEPTVNWVQRCADLELLLDEVLTEMSFDDVFISSREKMHPTGQQLRDDLIARVRAALAQNAQKPVEAPAVATPVAYAVRCITDDEGVEEWEDIHTSPDIAQETCDALESTSTDRFVVTPLYTAPPTIEQFAREAIAICIKESARECELAFSKACSDACNDCATAIRNLAEKYGVPLT